MRRLTDSQRDELARWVPLVRRLARRVRCRPTDRDDVFGLAALAAVGIAGRWDAARGPLPPLLTRHLVPDVLRERREGYRLWVRAASLDRIREESRGGRHDPEPVAPAPRLHPMDAAGAIERALAVLTDRERAAFLARAEGRTFRAVAEVSGTTVQAVQRLVERGRERCRRQLPQYIGITEGDSACPPTL